MASCGQIFRQSQQFVQLVSAGRVSIPQILRHLSQLLHDLVLYTLKREMLLRASRRPPVGQTNLHHACEINKLKTRSPRTIPVLTSHIRLACSKVKATEEKKSPTRIGIFSRG
jgi:hypothetical protein